MFFPNLNKLVNEERPIVPALPKGWEEILSPVIDDIARSFKNGGLHVIFSRSTFEGERQQWRHISVTYMGGPPTWDQIMLCKNLFLGTETEAMQVIPGASDHINVAHCWHFWSPIV